MVERFWKAITASSTANVGHRESRPEDRTVHRLTTTASSPLGSGRAPAAARAAISGQLDLGFGQENISSADVKSAFRALKHVLFKGVAQLG